MIRNGQVVKLLARSPPIAIRFKPQSLSPSQSGGGAAIGLTTQSSQAWHQLARPQLNPRSLQFSNLRSLPPVYRFISTKPLPHKRGPVFRFCYRLFAYSGASVLILGALVGAFFVYDSTTYREDLSYTDIPVSVEALYPRRGGPKNLPIADVLVDDDDCEDNTRKKNKPKLVVLGSGWGSVALLKQLNPEDYHVTVVSPCNYFLFTPMLPSATVGTLELRSLIEPIRRIVQRIKGHFLRAEAVDVELTERLIEVAQRDASGELRHFYLPYDKLVIGVGSTTNPHGVKGLENCHFLKSVEDAQAIRSQLGRNVEAACLPTTSDEERRRLLSFVISGGGPTGVEFAAELFDFLNEDLARSFPKILRNEVSVHVIQSRGHILNTYDEALSQYAEEKLAHDQVEVLTNSRVKEVLPEKILFTQKNENGETITKEIPHGFCLWSTGVLQNNIADHLIQFLRGIAYEKGSDPETVEITFSEWRGVAQRVKKRFPQASDHLRRLDKLFEQYDKDKSGSLDFGELRELLVQIDSKLTSLPATAQRAHQQGQYLGRKLNKLAQAAPGMAMNQMDYGDLDAAVYKAFEYKHMGSLAYVGNAAIFDFNGMSFSGGLLAVYLWRSVYFAQSVSFRTRVLMAMDWTKRALFGRGEQSPQGRLRRLDRLGPLDQGSEEIGPK
ncbi:MAG: hypothetical protein Q9191_000346 [Dirinaria sp. TL-2023a]